MARTGHTLPTLKRLGAPASDVGSSAIRVLAFPVLSCPSAPPARFSAERNGNDAQGQLLRWNAPGLTWGGSVPDPPNPNPQPPKKMPQLRVLLSFAEAPDHALEERAQSVLDHLYVDDGLAVYPRP
jgi:hypothetical protein